MEGEGASGPGRGLRENQWSRQAPLECTSTTWEESRPGPSLCSQAWTACLHLVRSPPSESDGPAPHGRECGGQVRAQTCLMERRTESQGHMEESTPA